MKACTQDKCTTGRPARFRFLWPGAACAQEVCGPHAAKAQAVAKAMGFTLAVEEFALEGETRTRRLDVDE